MCHDPYGIDSMPAELDEVSRRVLQLEIEETALKQEKDKSSKDRLEALRKELGNARDKMETIKRQWENERKGIDDVLFCENKSNPPVQIWSVPSVPMI